MRLYGKRPLLERLRANPKSIRQLILQQETDTSEVAQAAKDSGIPLTILDKRRFLQKAGDVHAQGVLAEVEEFRYAELEGLLKAGSWTFFLLDRVTDPQNLGAILRTTACFGGIALVLPKHDSV